MKINLADADDLALAGRAVPDHRVIRIPYFG